MVLIQELVDEQNVEALDNLPMDEDAKDAISLTPVKLHIRIKKPSSALMMNPRYDGKEDDHTKPFPSILDYTLLPTDEDDEFLIIIRNLSYGFKSRGLGMMQNFSGCMDTAVNVISQTFNAMNYLMITLPDHSKQDTLGVNKILCDVHTLRALLILQKSKVEPAFIVDECGDAMWFEAIVKSETIQNAVASIPDTKLLVTKVAHAANFVLKDISYNTGISPAEIPIDTVIQRCNVAFVQKEVRSMLSSSASLFAPKEDKMEDPEEMAQLEKSFIQLMAETDTTGVPVTVKIETGEMTELNGNKVQNPNAEQATFTL